MRFPLSLTKEAIAKQAITKQTAALLLAFALGLCLQPLAHAQTQQPGPDNLDQLLERVKQHQTQEKRLYEERKQRFLKARNQQKQLLKQAKADFLAAQKANNPLQAKSDANQKKLNALRAERDDHIQDMGDIHSIYNAFAGDFIARMRDSLVQTQLPQREQQLTALAATDTLPDIDSMRSLWLQLMEEMTEAGKVAHYPASLIQADGTQTNADIIRIGSFTAIHNGQLLHYIPESQELVALAKQPDSTASYLTSLEPGNTETLQWTLIDPSRGSLLSILGKAPSLQERILQGKEVGMVIIAIAVLGLLFSLYRFIRLTHIRHRVQQQLKTLQTPTTNNPLGRILHQVQGITLDEDNSLQSSLDEAILKEMPALEQGQSFIKLLAAIAPLLGLLGTVIGMISTFQSISLYGSGDPKLMADGISQALITTVLGLVAAIPLLFSHNLLSSLSCSIIQVLDEQSAGIIARHFETQADT